MEKFVILGKGNPSGQNVGIGANARARSTYVIGITGTGKSTLLETMAFQDMANLDGLCFLDPHGDSANKLLASVPDFRESDVIFWDPSDREKPFGLNPFYCPNSQEIDSKADNFIAALASLKEFKEIFDTAPLMKIVLNQLAITFIVNQGCALTEAPEFLTNAAFRQKFYPALNIEYPQVRRFWEQIDELPNSEQRAQVASSLNKLQRFQNNRIMRGIFGQSKPSIDFRSAMDSGAIILVKLSVKALGEDNAAFIGAFIVWEILQAAFSRENIPEQERRPFHLFADEFQTYMTTAFPTLQAQARKYRLDIVIAHQVRAQLTPEIAEITPAVGNLIIFRVTSHNAEALASEFNTTPPPAELVPQMITKPVYESYSEVTWTPKEAETEYKEVSKQLDQIQAEAKCLAKAFFALDLDDFIRMLTLPKDTYISIPERFTHADHIYQQLNPDHGDKRVEEYARNRILRPNTFTLRKAGRQTHPFPSSLPSAVESRLQRKENEPYSKALLNELGVVLAPLKERAVYWYDPSRSIHTSQGHNGNGKWEITPFPTMLEWLLSKATALKGRRDALAQRKDELWKTCRKEEYKQKYLYDKPVRVSTPSSRSSEQEVATYRWVPGTPRQRSDVAAEIANQLTSLANFQAKVKLTQENARPTEHLVLTYDYPGIENEELARSLHERSRNHYGRDRGKVEQAIEERLQVKREADDDGGEPILREKSKGKPPTTNKRKRPTKTSQDEEE